MVHAFGGEAVVANIFVAGLAVELGFLVDEVWQIIFVLTFFYIQI